MNKLILESKADLIARMDADDWSYPNRFEIQYEFMQEHPEITICGTNLECYDSKRCFIYPQNNEQIKAAMIFRSAIAHATIIFRKLELIKTGFFYDKNYKTIEDYALWLELTINTEIKFENIQISLYRYRLHPNKDRSLYIKKQVESIISKQIEIFKKILPSITEEDIKTHIRFMNFLYNFDKTFVMESSNLIKLKIWLKKIQQGTLNLSNMRNHFFTHHIGSLWQVYFLSLLRNKKYLLAVRAFSSSLFWSVPVTSDLNIFKRAFKVLTLSVKNKSCY